MHGMLACGGMGRSHVVFVASHVDLVYGMLAPACLPSMQSGAGGGLVGWWLLASVAHGVKGQAGRGKRAAKGQEKADLLE